MEEEPTNYQSADLFHTSEDGTSTDEFDLDLGIDFNSCVNPVGLGVVGATNTNTNYNNSINFNPTFNSNPVNFMGNGNPLFYPNLNMGLMGTTAMNFTPLQSQPQPQYQPQYQPQQPQQNQQVQYNSLQSQTQSTEMKKETSQLKGSPSIDDKASIRLSRQIAHNINEKKRQRTINQYIDDLKLIVPTCNEPKITKIAILQRCISYITYLQQFSKDMKEENARMRESKLGGSTSTSQLNKVSLLISKENEDSVPHRVDFQLTSLQDLKHLVSRMYSIEPEKIDILHFDPEFDNQLVVLTCVSHLPNKSRVLVRVKKEDDLYIQVQEETPTPTTSPQLSSSPAIEDVKYFPAQMMKDSARIFMVALFAFFFFSPSFTFENGVENIRSSRALKQFGPVIDNLPSDPHVIRLMEHILFIFKFFICFLVFRIVWYFREPSPSEDSKDINLPLAKEARHKAKRLHTNGDLAGSKREYLSALKYLGHDPNFTEWPTLLLVASIAVHSLVQHLHRYKIGKYVDSSVVNIRRGEKVTSELAHIYFGLWQISFGESKAVVAVTSLLIALNYAESTPCTEKSLLVDLYASIAFIINSFFPWGVFLILWTPAGYYKNKSYSMCYDLGNEQVKRLINYVSYLEQENSLFKPLYAVFGLMLTTAAYEYSTGHEIISIIVTGHLLFEFSLLCLQSLVENLQHYKIKF